MSEKIIAYKTRKLIHQIIFDYSNATCKDNNSLFDIIILKSLKNIIEDYVEYNYLNKYMINNINNFLYEARVYNDENREERIDIINKIIKIINRQKQDDSIIFYRLELFKRRKDKLYLFCSNDLVENEIKYIHDSICNDLCVLVSHTDIINDEEFINVYLPYFKNSNLYYESLNAMLEENPIVFKDKVFYDRVNQVLSLNNEIYKDTEEEKQIKKLNKKMIRQINKQVKTNMTSK